jgi:hypothetical protein
LNCGSARARSGVKKFCMTSCTESAKVMQGPPRTCMNILGGPPPPRDSLSSTEFKSNISRRGRCVTSL